QRCSPYVSELLPLILISPPTIAFDNISLFLTVVMGKSPGLLPITLYHSFLTESTKPKDISKDGYTQSHDKLHSPTTISMHCAAVATCGYMDLVSRQFGILSLKRDSMIDPCARRFRVLLTPKTGSFSTNSFERVQN
ncbi:unnamed protein product, partial [Onchocerca flexuosa]|uniref:Reverse transcriptase domain-containing protein n=1 Tax=Onchocerca flexuosa TaxID=387005 RepID=A0A183HKE6_9BILA